MNQTFCTFAEIIAYIEENYQYTPTAFKNGELLNAASQNQGSAKVLFFAQLNQMSKEDTLALFAEHYQNVLENPTADSHQNIRNIMKYGWEGVSFDGVVLEKK